MIIGELFPTLPEGLQLAPNFLTEPEQESLVQFFQTLPWGAVQMRGVTAKRRVVQFGWHYSFDTFHIKPAAPLPPELVPIRDRAAIFAGVEPEAFAEALVIEYSPGAGMGWHRDAPPFGIIAGISLGTPSRMRFQRGEGSNRRTASIDLPPRSIYLLTGEVRSAWQHSIPPVKQLRYSLTFRTLRTTQQ